mmetsp:Transcript_115391/g.337412  ORF Transcript_115391/g.337412 Transcript_115391/m.337412 type:complete len:213 (-) Transcript_115391:1106-1744(-)
MAASHFRLWKRLPDCAWLSQLRPESGCPARSWHCLSRMLRKCCSGMLPCMGTGKRTSSSPETPLRIRTLTVSAPAPPAAARALGVGGVSSGLDSAPPQKGEGMAEGARDCGMDGAQLAAMEKSSQLTLAPMLGEAAQHLGVRPPLPPPPALRGSIAPLKSSSACARGFLTAESREGEASCSARLVAGIRGVRAVISIVAGCLTDVASWLSER